MVPAGTRLGRYEVVRHLADGGMAELLLARTTGVEGFERHVVIKRIHSDQAHDGNYVRMFLDEARLAAMLHHHNIVQVHDVGQENGEYFFAMEYVHGEDLRKLLTHLKRNGVRPTLAQVLTIGIPVADALHYAHEMRGPDRMPLGIVHRDVSPANIIVGYDGNVKVVDFGIAKAALRSTETHSGSLKGKVAYMAPEQCLGAEMDRRSDIFSLGIVLWELVTVRRLFKGKSDYVTMSAIVAGKIPRPSKYRPDIPEELEAIIMKALSVSPADRFQTAAELRRALDAFGERSAIRTSTTALADFVKDQLGFRNEPWLDDDSIVEILSVDFDGGGGSLDEVAELPYVSAAPDSPFAVMRPRSVFDDTASLRPDDMATVQRDVPDLVEATAVGISARPIHAISRAMPVETGAETVVEAMAPGLEPPLVPPLAPIEQTPLPSLRSRRRLYAIAGAAGALVLLLLAGAVWLHSGGDAAAPTPVAPAAAEPPQPSPAQPAPAEPAQQPALPAAAAPAPAEPAPAPAEPAPAPAEPAPAPPAPAPSAVAEPPTATVVAPSAPVVDKKPPTRHVPTVHVVHRPPASHVTKTERAEKAEKIEKQEKAEKIEKQEKAEETKTAVNCNPPYYFEGDKKIFKPECL